MSDAPPPVPPTKVDYIIDTLNDIKAEQTRQGDKIYDIHGKVSGLEVKSSIFGVLGGALVTLVAYLKGGH